MLDLRAIETGLHGVRTWDLTYAGYRGDPLRAWMTLPTAHAPGASIPVVVSLSRSRDLPLTAWMP